MSATELGALARQAGGFSPVAEARIEQSLSPGMARLAARLRRASGEDARSRPPGWASLDLTTPPTLGFHDLSPEEALRINAFLPTLAETQPAPPFVLQAPAAERQRALLCLTQAIYYEAALEPTAGQQAVAQTVLNRLRNPGFPSSVCGVVYQGSQQVTGCQFSFTCDGSRERPPVASFWQKAQAVAEQALDGFVMGAVGTATHYHADYVFPRWGPTLVKIGQIGAHIFYRFPGPAGRLPSFRKPYGGGELRVSMAGPSPEAILAARAAAGTPSAPEQPVQFAINDPDAPDGVRRRVAGELVFGRRIPTKEEVERINTFLSAMDKWTTGTSVTTSSSAKVASSSRPAPAPPSTAAGKAPAARPQGIPPPATRPAPDLAATRTAPRSAPTPAVSGLAVQPAPSAPQPKAAG